MAEAYAVVSRSEQGWAGFGLATKLRRRQLAQRRVRDFGDAKYGFVYVDGHVHADHGKRTLPETHVARMRIAMPATTDDWVNDAVGKPRFVVTTTLRRIPASTLRSWHRPSCMTALLLASLVGVAPTRRFNARAQHE